MLQEASSRKINTGFVEERLPEKSYLLCILSTLNPEHKFFARDYVPAIKQNGARIEIMPLIPNPNGFYDNLPQIAVGASRTRGGGLSQTQRLEYAK